MRFTATTVLLAVQSANALIPHFPIGETPAQVLSSFLHALSNAGATIPTAPPIPASQSSTVPTPACHANTSTSLQSVRNTTVPALRLGSAPSLTAVPSNASLAPTLHSPWQWPTLHSAVTPPKTLASSLPTTTITPSAVLPVPGSTSRHPAPSALLPFLSYYRSFHRVSPHSSFITSTQAAAATSQPSSTAIVVVPITPSLQAATSNKPTSIQRSKGKSHDSTKTSTTTIHTTITRTAHQSASSTYSSQRSNLTVYTSVQSTDPRCPYPYPGIHCGPPKTTVVTKAQKPTSTTKKAAEKTSGSGVVGCGAPFCGK